MISENRENHKIWVCCIANYDKNFKKNGVTLFRVSGSLSAFFDEPGFCRDSPGSRTESIFSDLFAQVNSQIPDPPAGRLKKSAAASLIIVGDEMLAKQMKLAVMTPIRTRLTVNFPMEPLSEQETEQFIAYRLAHAKASKDLFEPEAVALIAAHCHGNRREIMNVGTLPLTEAFYRKEKTISSELFMGCDLLK